MWKLFSIFCFMLGTASSFVFAATRLENIDHVNTVIRFAPFFALLSALFAVYYSAMLARYEQEFTIFGRHIGVSMVSGELLTMFGVRIPLRYYFTGMIVIASIILALLLSTDWFISGITVNPHATHVYKIEYGPLVYFSFFILCVAITKIMYILSYAYRKSDSRSYREFLALNLIAFGLIYGPAALLFVILPLIFDSSTQIYPFTAFPLAVLLFYIAIVRYQFARVDEMNLLLEKRVEERTEQLQDAHARMAQAEKMASLGQLVAGVAHEINTPMGAIRSMHSTLRTAIEHINEIGNCADLQSETEHKWQANMQVINDANRVIADGSDRVARIVKQLKSFARLDQAELQRADLHEGIESTLQLIHHELKDKVKVVKEFGDLSPVPCFPAQLNQVWLNLIVNAVQAFPEGKGIITIRTREDKENVTVQIADNGHGIPKDKLSRVFDPGYTTKGVGVGTGLGLAICYRILQDHHGQITVSSEEGKGTTFTIQLPRDLDIILNNKKNGSLG